MSDKIGLEDAIIANPGDYTPALIFADERGSAGDTAREEFIRLQCGLSQLTDIKARQDNVARQNEILNARSADGRTNRQLWADEYLNRQDIPPEVRAQIHSELIPFERGVPELLRDIPATADRPAITRWQRMAAEHFLANDSANRLNVQQAYVPAPRDEIDRNSQLLAPDDSDVKIHKEAISYAFKTILAMNQPTMIGRISIIAARSLQHGNTQDLQTVIDHRLNPNFSHPNSEEHGLLAQLINSYSDEMAPFTNHGEVDPVERHRALERLKGGMMVTQETLCLMKDIGINLNGPLHNIGVAGGLHTACDIAQQIRNATNRDHHPDVPEIVEQRAREMLATLRNLKARTADELGLNDHPHDGVAV